MKILHSLKCRIYCAYIYLVSMINQGQEQYLFHVLIVFSFLFSKCLMEMCVLDCSGINKMCKIILATKSIDQVKLLGTF